MEYQNIRNKLIAVPKDQVITPAGKLDRVKQNATLWDTKGGVKHYKGWALCDGSAYDANVFPELDAALSGAGVLPNGPYRTRKLGFTTFAPSGDNLIQVIDGDDVRQSVNSTSYFRVFSDKENNWYLEFQALVAIVANSSTSWSVKFANLTILNTTPITVMGNFTGRGTQGQAFQNAGSIELKIYTDVAISNNSMNMSGVLPISKPSFVDANLEDYPVIACYDNVLSSSMGLPSAGKETKGLVSFGDINQVLENECINGSFDFNQRGGASYTANGYCLDRFYMASDASTTLTTTQEQFAIGQTEVIGNPENYAMCVVASGSLVNSYAQFNTRLEKLSKYSGEWVTVGVDLKADAAKDVSFEF